VALAPGDEFAGYTIESTLGTGGMGAVYLAKHPRLPRRDALKLLNPAFSADANFRARFEREADLASGLIHRNIVAVYDRGSVDGQLWIAMQYVAGTDASVAAHAGDGSMTPARVVHIIAEVGSGLDFAHRSGLLHRDVKPANILLAAPDDPSEPEHVLLTDFGIAKSTDEVQHLTGTGNLLATLAYASPEQIEAQPLDHRVDIYALGCVLYELLTGSVPFPESSPFATMTAHLKNPPPRPTDAMPWLPAGFDAVVAKAMAKNPDDRYSTCRELSLAARAALAASAPAASDPTRAETAPPPAARAGAAGSADGPAAVPGAASSIAAPGGPGAAPAQADAAAVAAASISLTAPRPPYAVSVRRTSAALGTVAELGPVSTNYLSATNRIALEELLQRSRFFDLPPRLPLEFVVPGDVFQEITVSNNEVSRTVGYEREGSRHPAELDEIISMLERLAGWQQTHQSGGVPRGQYPAGWTPTATVPPLGGAAYRVTEAHPPQVPAAAGAGPSGTGGFSPAPSGPGQFAGAPAGQFEGAPTGRFAGVPAGPYGGPTGPNTATAQFAGLPPGGPPPGGGHHTGPTAGYPQAPVTPTPMSMHTGPHSATQQSKSALKWILVSLVAVLVVVGSATAFVLTRSSDPQPPAGPSTPSGLTAAADGRDVTVSWSSSNGATGYTLSRNSEVVYTGTNTRYSDAKLSPGTYNYAVTATNAAGLTSSPSELVKVTVTDPWGNAAFVVDDFPDLLPATPTDKGYADATCSITSDTENSGVDAIIDCTDPQGVFFEVMHFPTEDVKNAYLERDYGNVAVTKPWEVDGVEKGTLYRTADDEAKLPYVFTSFNDDARLEYLLYVHWQDHTTTQLIDQWWTPAPF
jgi:hypothetical protein